MKGKNSEKSSKIIKRTPETILHQLNNHLQSYLEALKSVNDNNEYRNLIR